MKLMRTSVIISINSIQGAWELSHHLGGKAVIVCSWPGVSGMSQFAVHTESKVFNIAMRENGRLDCRDHLVLAIVHPHLVTLSKLPPINIGIMIHPTHTTEDRTCILSCVFLREA